ncbi:uncharacterized protein LOC128393856 [Panonychus citri]|uniref:uncharacterized protein LOC128393856 n=1 Tax=Panonychus citri TaxID=50023 RepID=UPI0023070D37|nr:uncharacterized protein LOC128393856 [Panonychus citri]
MLINELPDDCLLMIFDYSIFLEDLTKLSKVCLRWKSLINYRLNGIKYLLVQRGLDDPPKSVMYKHGSLFMESNVPELLPNLEIIDLECYIDDFDNNDMEKLIECLPKLRGLIHPLCFSDLFQRSWFNKIEMLVCEGLGSWHEDSDQSFALKQLYLSQCYLSSLNDHHCYLKNLLRLHVDDYHSIDRYASGNFYRGPVLPNLKILEILSDNVNFPGYDFMDSCPSLESAYFATVENISFVINGSIKNLNLKNLAIDHLEGKSQDWSSLRTLLMKFPNLTNLAIRDNKKINDDNVKELITILPKIKLMDFRGSKKVTKKSADYLEEFCRRSGQSIVFYYNIYHQKIEIPADLEPDYSICIGFDFMKHCFFKYYHCLPMVLDF